MYPRLGTSVIEPTHYASLCMDLECKLFFMNRNVMYTDFSTIASQL